MSNLKYLQYIDLFLGGSNVIDFLVDLECLKCRKYLRQLQIELKISEIDLR